MKRFISILLCCGLIFTFCACGDTTATTSDSSSDAATSAAESTVDTDSTAVSESESVAANSESVSSVPAKKNPVKIMPMGDSLTQGGDHNDCGAYRGPLSEMLKEDGVAYEFVGPYSGGKISTGQTKHAGAGGIDLFGMEKRLNEYAGFDPDIILLMVGRNDNTRGITGDTFATYLYDRVISKLYEMYPNVTVYMASIPPVRKGEEERLAGDDMAQSVTLDSIKKLVAEKKGDGKKMEFVDMSAEATGLVWQDFDSDFVHPLMSGYTKIATQWHNAIKDKVAELEKSLNP